MISKQDSTYTSSYEDVCERCKRMVRHRYFIPGTRAANPEILDEELSDSELVDRMNDEKIYYQICPACGHQTEVL